MQRSHPERNVRPSRGETMNKLLLVFTSVLLFAACGTIDSLDSKTEIASASKFGRSNRQFTATAMIDPDLEIKEFYFVSLNKKLKPTGDTIYGASDSLKKHTYRFPKTNLKTDVAFFEIIAQGKEEKTTVKFNTITELGWRNEVGVSFLSTILVPRIKELYLKHGYPLETAKYTSLHEFEKDMQLPNKIFDIEDFNPLIFPYYSEQAFNYITIFYYPWFIVRGDKSLDEYQQLKTSLAENFKESGIFTDTKALISLGDFAQSSKANDLDLIDSMINTYKNEGYLGYLETKILTAGYCAIATIHYDCSLTSINDWLYTIPMRLYGLGSCGRDNIYKSITDYRDGLYYCDIKRVSDNCDTTFEWRNATELESKIGLCNGDSAATMNYVTLDSVQYKCAPDWNWYPAVTSDYFLKLDKENSTTANNIYFVEDRDAFMSTAYSYKRNAYQVIDFVSSRCQKTKLQKHYSESDRYW